MMLGMRSCAMCIFLFLKFYNFIKGMDVAHIHSIFKQVQTTGFILINFFKCLTFNRTDVSLFKQVNE